MNEKENNKYVRAAMQEMLLHAKATCPRAAALTRQEKDAALHAMADEMLAASDDILAANAADLNEARDRIGEVMLDRLRLDPARLRSMAEGMRAVAALPDPVGRVLSTDTRPNGLTVQKVAVPIGVIAVIYESRPNVTSDAAALILKSGNVSVLRGGREAYRSSHAILRAMRAGLRRVSLPETLINMPDDASRESATALMTATDTVDLLIPRGGAGLIRTCVENARVPCIRTGTGICHIYVDRAADTEKALNIIENAKASRPSVCNAAEVCLVHRDIARAFLPRLAARLGAERISRGLPPVSLRCDPEAYRLIGGTPAAPTDFDTEFLDYVLAVAVVDDVEGAIAHIARHSTGHSEAIVTEDPVAAARFTAAVDSAAVYVNASTRFTDGGEFGLGCEIGISTQKLHARGPMGLSELTSYKYIVTGDGQIR